ncbi:MAG: metallophosphoesterase family protein [Gemmatimonadales bacterium]|jgi:putative phosphoesterase
MDERRDSRAESTVASAGTRWVGVISDTHGLLRPGVFKAFRGVSHILHAGDVGDPLILEDLATLAPVTAVWGNMDGSEIRAVTREEAVVELARTPIAVIHGHQLSDYGSLPARFPTARVIVHGHTHLPSLDRIDDALVLNPGSAGPRRAGKPVTVALLELDSDGAHARHLHL